MMPSIKEAYYKLVKANQPPEVIITPPKKRVKSSEGVIVEGIDNCLTNSPGVAALARRSDHRLYHTRAWRFHP